jgi:hypothetical protein
MPVRGGRIRTSFAMAAFRIDEDGLLAAAFRALTLLFPRNQNPPILSAMKKLSLVRPNSAVTR